MVERRLPKPKVAGSRPVVRFGRAQLAVTPLVHGVGGAARPGSGTSGELDQEHLTKTLPSPGHYRLEINNWGGAPANSADLTFTFFDRDGNPGPPPGWWKNAATSDVYRL